MTKSCEIVLHVKECFFKRSRFQIMVKEINFFSSAYSRERIKRQLFFNTLSIGGYLHKHKTHKDQYQNQEFGTILVHKGSIKPNLIW